MSHWSLVYSKQASRRSINDENAHVVGQQGKPACCSQYQMDDGFHNHSTIDTQEIHVRGSVLFRRKRRSWFELDAVQKRIQCTGERTARFSSLTHIIYQVVLLVLVMALMIHPR